jgi:hypothetical protein
MTDMTIPPIRLLAFALFWLLLSGAAAGSAFQPFFDDNPDTRHAPEPPALTPLDSGVLALCGDWGARVQAHDFEKLLLDPAHRDSLQRIHEALDGRVYSRATDPVEFVRQLRRAWFEQNGFRHIFCGEPGVGRDLGGLHYAPRYWQAQNEGWAGYRKLARDPHRRPLEKCRRHFMRERIEPPLYSISVSFLNPRDPGNNVKCVAGYHHHMDAERLLIVATRAFRQANGRADRDVTTACLYETAIDEVDPHYSTLVIRQRAIRTFYPLPDRRPYCRKDQGDFRACLCSRL